MKKFITHKITIAVFSFLLGAAWMWSYQTYTRYKQEAERIRRSIENPWGSLFEQFMPENPIENEKSWFSHITDLAESFTIGEMIEREDGDFYYYEFDIKNKKPTEINVSVENGYITIQGRLESVSSSASHSSTFSFNKTFPAPPNIDAENYNIEQIEDKLVIKFKKSATI